MGAGEHVLRQRTDAISLQVNLPQIAQVQRTVRDLLDLVVVQEQRGEIAGAGERFLLDRRQIVHLQVKFVQQLQLGEGEVFNFLDIVRSELERSQVDGVRESCSADCLDSVALQPQIFQMRCVREVVFDQHLDAAEDHLHAAQVGKCFEDDCGEFGQQRPPGEHNGRYFVRWIQNVEPLELLQLDVCVDVALVPGDRYVDGGRLGKPVDALQTRYIEAERSPAQQEQ